MKRQITVTPDGRIKALDTQNCEYVYLENKLYDEDRLLFYHGKNQYCFFDLSNDPVADTAKKLKVRHGRTKAKVEKEINQAKRLENKVSWYTKVIGMFHN